MQAVFLDTQTFSENIDFSAIEKSVTTLSSYNTTTAEQVISRCLSAEVIITNKVVLNKKTLQNLPKLKLICIAATGTNNVDIAAASALGITVTNVSGYANQSVAQYVFTQLLAYFNQIHHHNSNTEQGLWQQSKTFCHHGNNIHELAGKTLGIIGYGSLGQAVAKIASAFDMKVIIAERPQCLQIRAGRTTFENVVKDADIISLHCPQTPETENLVDQNFLAQMKPSAVLVNTARGALIDNNALLNALKNKTITYAILDVLEQEPPPKDHQLLANKHDNLKITAHIAWASMEAQQRLINILVDNIISFNKGKIQNNVN